MQSGITTWLAYYDAASGKMVKDKTKIEAYGKGTNANGHTSYTGYTTTDPYTGKVIIEVTVDTEKGDITEKWV